MEDNVSQCFNSDANEEAEPIEPVTRITQEEWFHMKNELLKLDIQQNHAIRQTLSYKEMVVERKLNILRREMLESDPVLITASHYEKLDKLQNSALYDCLKMMPKPAIHHTHLTATADVKFLVELTYNDFVYYSEKENMFYSSLKGCEKPSYIKVNTLRQYAKSAVEFDKSLEEKMLLRPSCPEDHGIWADFQPKFMLTNHLYNFAPLFEKILYRASKNYIKEMVTIVEYRHIFGMVFDDNGPLTVEQELQIFKRVEMNIRQMFPLFRIKIINCALKFAGVPHTKAMLKAIADNVGSPNYQMIAGFDAVNEEDYNMPLDDMLEQIMITKQALGGNLQVYFHAGESYSCKNKELYDAILIGSKRIGHGFALAKYKKLIDLVKEKAICVECCPVSNRVLGYTPDLRCHPVRGLLAQGVKVSINPDD